MIDRRAAVGALPGGLALASVLQGDDMTTTEIIGAMTTSPAGGAPLLFEKVTGLHARLNEIRRPELVAEPSALLELRWLQP